jgi:hypothetical protein
MVNDENSRIRIHIRSESGSVSVSISQRHGSADPDPDPPQNVMDPQHWFDGNTFTKDFTIMLLAYIHHYNPQGLGDQNGSCSVEDPGEFNTGYFL